PRVPALRLRARLVQRVGDLLRPIDREPVHLAERGRAGHDRVDPGRLERLQLQVELVEVRADREPAVGRELEGVAVSVAAAARVIRQIEVRLPEQTRVPVRLRIDYAQRLSPARSTASTSRATSSLVVRQCTMQARSEKPLANEAPVTTTSPSRVVSCWIRRFSSSSSIPSAQPSGR